MKTDYQPLAGASETSDLRYKTAAVYILSDWFHMTPGEILETLRNTSNLGEYGWRDGELQQVEDNINARGRHDLRINIHRHD